MSIMEGYCPRCFDSMWDASTFNSRAKKTPEHVLQIIREHRQPDQIVSAASIRSTQPSKRRNRCLTSLLAQVRYRSPPLGTTDDCGFAPFADDASTSREIAFEKYPCTSGRDRSWPLNDSPAREGTLCEGGVGRHLAYRCWIAPLRHAAGGEPVARLNARLNAASES